MVLIAAWSNAVNFTDGLDGLAAGSSVMVLGTYVVICFCQFRNSCTSGAESVASGRGCYNVRDPLDLAVVAAAAFGGCIGFLWWNAHPARIFMGDTGSLAAGRPDRRAVDPDPTELLLVVIAGLFVVEMLSVVIQILVFKTRHVRVFKMAPFHHHFELVRLGRDHGDGAVLVAGRDVRGARARPVLRRLAVPDRGLAQGVLGCELGATSDRTTPATRRWWWAPG